MVNSENKCVGNGSSDESTIANEDCFLELQLLLVSAEDKKVEESYSASESTNYDNEKLCYDELPRPFLTFRVGEEGKSQIHKYESFSSIPNDLESYT